MLQWVREIVVSMSEFGFEAISPDAPEACMGRGRALHGGHLTCLATSSTPAAQPATNVCEPPARPHTHQHNLAGCLAIV